jgi:hypothetical protein
MTLGELIWTWRQRQGFSLVEAANRFGVAKGRWVGFEADRFDPPDLICQQTTDLNPTITEELRVWRRRSGLGSRGAAKAFGKSHVSLLRLERAGSQELLEWYLTPSHHIKLYN